MDMKNKAIPFQVRYAYREEWNEAMELAWRTFLRFEAPDYRPEGVRSFYDFVTDERLRQLFLTGSYQMLAAFVENRMAGMITLRGEGHISLLFVEERYHKCGIGRALVTALADYLRNEMGIERMTVNSSPYGIGFYHKLGFRDLGAEKELDGVRYTPMEKML